MIKPINKDILFLQQKAEPATQADAAVMKDLKDTMQAHQTDCAGMAANMIGANKRIIIVNLGMTNLLMLNPVILKQSGKYETTEGCLSLPGERPCTRYKEITVEYQDEHMNKHVQKFSGWVSEIVQHEMDHLEGILI